MARRRSLRRLLLATWLLASGPPGAIAEEEGQAYAAHARRDIRQRGDLGRVPEPCVLRDPESGLPVGRGSVRRYLEQERFDLLSHAVLDDVAAADPDGVCWPATPAAAEGDYHWVAAAPGHAESYSYGHLPPARFECLRGVDLDLLICNALGDPAGDALAELYLGCDHGPAIRIGRTSAEGILRLTHVPVANATLRIVASGCAAADVPIENLICLDSGPIRVCLSPGAELRGRVVDAAGLPIAGAVVRAKASVRGPAVATDGEGGFVLPGLAGRADASVFRASPVETGEVALAAEDWTPGIPAVFRLGLTEAIRSSDPTTPVEITFDGGSPTPSGEPLAEAVRLSDGVHFAVGRGDPTAAPGSVARRSQRIELPEGQYEIRPRSDFSAYSFTPQPFTLRAGSPASLRITVFPQARLRIEGVIPEGATALLATQTSEVEIDVSARGARSTHVPPTGRLALRVYPAQYGVGRPASPVYVFAVSEGSGLERSVLAEFPVGQVLHLTPGVGGSRSLSVRVRGLRADLRRVDEATFESCTRGAAEVLIDRDPGHTIRLPLVLGETDRRSIDLDPLLIQAIEREATLSVEPPAGTPADSIRVRSFREGIGWEEELPDGGHLRVPVPSVLEVAASGYQPLRVRVETAAAIEARWAVSSLKADIVDELGQPSRAWMLIDGLPTNVSGQAIVRGLAPGKHRVVFVPLAREDEGIAFTEVVQESGSTIKRIVFPWR